MIVKEHLSDLIDKWDDAYVTIYDRSDNFKNTIFYLWDMYIASVDENLIGLRLYDNVMDKWDYENALRATIALEIDLHKKNDPIVSNTIN